MKRALWFFIAALFILLVVNPNLSANWSAEKNKIPVYDETAALRTNNDVETRQCASRATIVIDPQRGGKDEGYTSSSTMAEKELLMQLAVAIGNALESEGYHVEYTRWYDDVPACSNTAECESSRINKAKELNANYILSLSLNQDTRLHRGYSIFIQPDNEQMDRLAKDMVSQLEATSYSRFEGIDTDHYDSFDILKDTSIPSILLQLGYITNPQDYASLSDPKIQSRVADAIAKAFLEAVD